MSVGLDLPAELLGSLRELTELLRTLDARFAEGALLVTAREAAKALRISERTLYSLTHEAEELSCVMVGRKKLYEVAELNQWIAARKITGPSQCEFPNRADNAKQG